MLSSYRYLNELFQRYPQLDQQPILDSFQLLLSCCRRHDTVYVCGNGGSAADCEHIVGELMKGFLCPRTLSAQQQDALKKALSPKEAQYFISHLQQGLPAVSLVSQTGFLTAYGNDVASDMIFAQQIFSYANSGDVLLAITTSGGSVNVLNALKIARTLGVKSILLMGNRNLHNATLADVAISVNESETYLVQELHLPIYHALCAQIEAELFLTQPV